MILVTGINGMLGNAVLDQLLERGTRVRGFDLHPHPNPQVESIVGDIRNLSDVRLACDGVEGVIHLASLVDLHLGQPPRLYDINVTGVENLIAACREKQVPRLVYMSSAEVISGASPLRNALELGYQLTKAERLAYPLFTRHQLLLGTRDYYLDSSKVRNKLGYSPRFDRAEAIARTQKWLTS